MTIYCPQTDATYNTLTEFEAAVNNQDFGETAVGEVSGTVDCGTLLNGPYPNGIELRAAAGEEFSGVEGVGACLSCPNSTNGIHVDGDSTGDRIEIRDLQICNASGYASSLVHLVSYYKFNVLIERCGLFNRANPHSYRRGIIAQQNGSNIGIQEFTLRDSVIVANAEAVNISGSRSGAESVTVENCTIEGNNASYSALVVDGTNCHVKNVFAFGASTTDITPTSYGTFDYIASGDSTANVATNNLTTVTTSEFQDYGNGDYQIIGGSQLVGAGEAGGNIGGFALAGGGGLTEVLQQVQSNWDLLEAISAGRQINWGVGDIDQIAKMTRLAWNATSNVSTDIVPVPPDTLNAGSGEDIVAGRFSMAETPVWRALIAPNTWAEVGANTLNDINPRYDDTINPDYPNSPPWLPGFQYIVTAWCGACFDEEGQVLWLPLNGGHADYAGNEPYKINLSYDDPTWEMVRSPSGAIGNEITLNDGAAAELTGLYADGRPRSIHSYNKPVYIPGVGPAISTQGNCSFSGSNGPAKPILISPITGEMTRHGAVNPDGNQISGSSACYDPTRHCIWYRGANTGRFVKYDIDADSWETVGDSHDIGGYTSITYLPDHDCILWTSTGLTNGFAVFDCATNTLHEPSITGTFVGGAALNGRNQPCLFDTNTLALWDNTSDTTIINTLSFASNPRTDTWQIGQLPVDPGNTVTPTVKAANGTYGRFFYSKKYDCFGVFNSINDKLFMYARS